MGAKYANKTSFKVGSSPIRQKGTLAKKTLLKQKINKVITSDIGEYMNDGGIAGLLADIELLPLKERVIARLALLEYAKPKLSRMEVSVETTNAIVNVFGMIPNEPTKIPVRIEPETIEDISDISEHIEINDTE